jgi:hypothetical protein
MITKNMNYYITIPISNPTDGTSTWDGNRAMKSTDGTSYTNVSAPSNTQYNGANTYMYDLGASSESQDVATSTFKSDIIIGAGTTQETDDDYRLENQIILDYAGKHLDLIYDENNKVIGLKCQKTYTNNTTETYQITEIGYTKTLRTTTSSSSTIKKFLLARETFSPIAVAPNQSITASFIYMFE